jgi:hypothetical protein
MPPLSALVSYPSSTNIIISVESYPPAPGVPEFEAFLAEHGIEAPAEAKAEL